MVAAATYRVAHTVIGWVIMVPVLALALIGFGGLQTRLLFNLEFSHRMETARVIASSK